MIIFANNGEDRGGKTLAVQPGLNKFTITARTLHLSPKLINMEIPFTVSFNNTSNVINVQLCQVPEQRMRDKTWSVFCNLHRYLKRSGNQTRIFHC